MRDQRTRTSGEPRLALAADRPPRPRPAGEVLAGLSLEVSNAIRELPADTRLRPSLITLRVALLRAARDAS
jgi:hypothetical protein